jgi:hypothetical protein
VPDEPDVSNDIAAATNHNGAAVTPVVEPAEVAPYEAPPDLDTSPLTDFQRDALARMVVAGVPRRVIASHLRRSAKSIARHLSSPKTLERVDYYQGQALDHLSRHYFGMLDMLDDARMRIHQGINSQDARLAVETSKWLIDAVMPKVDRHEVEHTVTAEVGADLSNVFGRIADSLEAITTANAGRDPLARVRTGPNALPRPTVALAPTSSTDDAA